MIAHAKILGDLASAAYFMGDYRAFTLATGCMDLLHMGHVMMLKAARRVGKSPLFVGVNSDASIRRLKGRNRPICPLADRMFMLAELTAVDGVFWFEDDTVVKVLETLRPRVWVKGGDWTLKTLNKAERRAAKKVGTKIIIVRRMGSWSTSSILKKI